MLNNHSLIQYAKVQAKTNPNRNSCPCDVFLLLPVRAVQMHVAASGPMGALTLPHSTNQKSGDAPRKGILCELLRDDKSKSERWPSPAPGRVAPALRRPIHELRVYCSICSLYK